MDVVLASIDCARVDALQQRFFERLKATGQYYDTCITQASFTSPSHSSMLSGTYPFNHGVRWLLDYELETPTLPEILSEEGYNTAAFIGGHPLPTGDMDEGFGTFDHVDIVSDEIEGRQNFGPANVLVTKAMNWLAEREGEDNFVFLHFFDLHFTFRSELVGRDPPSVDEDNTYSNVEQYIGRQRRRYYEEADFVAAQLELLHEAVDIDLSVVTGDHGSKMPYEHGYPWNYNHDGERVGSHFWGAELYDNVIRVPLFVNGSGIEQQTVRDQVRSIDIVPTVLDALDISHDANMDGQSLLSNDPPELAYSETYHAQLTRANKQAYQMQQEHGFGWDLSPLVAVRTNEWKLICTADGEIEPIELYHIAKDPSEAQNLVDDPKAEPVRDRLKQRLYELIGDDDQPRREAESVDEETRKTLEDLGYL